MTDSYGPSTGGVGGATGGGAGGSGSSGTSGAPARPSPAPVAATPPESPPPPAPVFATTGNVGADAVLGTLDSAISPFRSAPPPEQGAAGAVSQYVGGALGLINAPATFIDTAVSVGVSSVLEATGLGALFPAMPIACIGVSMHMGTPHTHVHPPSLIPPAPPIPLPSFGVAFLAGSASVLIGGLPALRAGDVGIGLTCGSLAPPFEIVTGASGVYVGGSRVARIGMDITMHCNPASPMGAASVAMGVAGMVVGAMGAAGQASAGNDLASITMAAQVALDAAAMALSMLRGKDPAGPPGMGMLLGPPPTVLAGGPPIPNVGAWAQGKIFAALKKAAQAAGRRARRRTPAPDANGRRCDAGEPVHVVTGANFNTHTDFVSFHRGFEWARHTTTARASEHGPMGWGWQHAFEHRLEVRLHRATFFGFEGERIDFPRFRFGEREIRSNGYVLERLSPLRYRVTQRRMGALEFELVRANAIVAQLRSIRTENAFIELGYDPTRRLVEAAERSLRYDAPLARYYFGYDRDGQLTEVRGGIDGQSMQRLAAYGFDQAGHLIAAEDTRRVQERFGYDHRHRLIDAADRNGYRYRWEYDLESRCVFTSGQDGLWFARFEYEPAKGRTRMTMHDGSVRTYEYDQDGVITKQIDPYGGVRERLRDPDGRVLAEIDSGGRTLTFLYDADGAHVGRLDRFGNLYGPELEQPHVADPFRRHLPATARARAFGIAALGEADGPEALGVIPSALLATAQDVLRPSGPSPAPVRQYDHQGRVVRETDALGRARQWAYDGAGNMVEHLDRDGSVRRRLITSWNLVGAEVDPLGNAVQYTYDPHEQTRSIVDPLGTRSAYDYDSKSRLVRVHRHDRVREEYVYDVGDNLIEKRGASGATLLRFTPNDNALVGKIELASGGAIELEYDERGRPIRADTNEHALSMTWDRHRRLLSTDCDGRTLAHVYDDARLRSTFVAEEFEIRRERAADGESIIVDPAGRARRIRADQRGLVRIDHGNGTEEVQQYDAEGRLEGRLVWRLAQDGALVSWNVRYVYGGEGDLLAVRDSARGVRQFQVDAAHRLAAEIGPDGQPRAYTLDPAGNLLVAPGLAAVSVGPGNRLRHAGFDTFEYDERDHVGARFSATRSLRYLRDSFDQLIRIDDGTGEDAWTATYDGLGRRVQAGRPGRRTTFWWDGDRLAAEEAPDGRFRIYVYADGTALVPLGFVDYDSRSSAPETGRSYSVFSDQVGMPLAVEDGSGRTVWWANRVDPYGLVDIDPSSEIEYHLRWPGHYFDSDTGLHYNRFRYYDPSIGRYLESDPIGCAGGVNLYAYRPNPLVSVDVLGLHGEQDHPPREPGDGRPGGEASRRPGDTETTMPSGLTRIESDAPAGSRLSDGKPMPPGTRMVQHVDESGVVQGRHFVDPQGRPIRSEVVIDSPASRVKDSSRPTPRDMADGDHRGHSSPERHAADQRAANVPENLTPEHPGSNLSAKKRWENQVPNFADENPGSTVVSVHEPTYPNDTTHRPSSSSHGIEVDGRRNPKYNSGPIPNDASARGMPLPFE